MLFDVGIEQNTGDWECRGCNSQWDDQNSPKRDFPGGPVVKTPHRLAPQGAWVQSLVGELSSHKP